jgi:hypothetical protein
VVKLWDLTPQMNLLRERHEEVYVAAEQGEAYVLYAVQGGVINLDLAAATGIYTLRWLSVDQGDWGPEVEIEGGAVVTLEAPDQGGWIAVLTQA